MSNAFCKCLLKHLRYSVFVEKVNGWSLITNFSQKITSYIFGGVLNTPLQKIFDVLLYLLLTLNRFHTCSGVSTVECYTSRYWLRSASPQYLNPKIVFYGVALIEEGGIDFTSNFDYISFDFLLVQLLKDLQKLIFIQNTPEIVYRGHSGKFYWSNKWKFFKNT